jgi:hypothetical protein
MTNKPQKHPSVQQAPSESSAELEAVHARQEPEAAEAKRKAEMELGQIPRGKDAAPLSVKCHLEPPYEEETDSADDSSDEPIVEDEP